MKQSPRRAELFFIPKNVKKPHGPMPVRFKYASFKRELFALSHDRLMKKAHPGIDL